jgi:hypothetical protein
MLTWLVATLAASATPEVNWSERLRSDAGALRRAILESHPGPVDPENPAFNQRLEAAYRQAIRRAERTTSFPAYFWALREFTASFDDGHLGINPSPATADSYAWSFRWAGVVTSYRGGAQIVTHSELPEVPIGARLVECDGQSAEALAEMRIGRFTGRWMLASTREDSGAFMLLPPDNPWLPTLSSCTFESNGKASRVRLTWRPLSAETRRELWPHTPRPTGALGIGPLPDGGYWIDMSSFDTDPASADGQALTKLNADIANQAQALRNAPRIVFDLRGNRGGSSAWVQQAAEAIWGAGAVASKAPRSEVVDWRVSDANIATLQHYREIFAPQRTTNPMPYDLVVRVLFGLEDARRRGASLWRQADDPADTEKSGASYAVRAKVFVLTDHRCVSACLNAVDLLTSLGAVHIGQETSADTNYIEVREETLADGTNFVLPMKVYRGRPRGSNVPAKPQKPWAGDISDTAALQKWVTSL